VENKIRTKRRPNYRLRQWIMAGFNAVVLAVVALAASAVNDWRMTVVFGVGTMAGLFLVWVARWEWLTGKRWAEHDGRH
jgi:hypothetical protein